MSCHVMAWHGMACHVMSLSVMLCHVMSCHAMSVDEAFGPHAPGVSGSGAPHRRAVPGCEGAQPMELREAGQEA